jgi:hypothetical protein
MLRLKASHGKSKSFHQAGSIPEWPEALCHNSADALPESKVEQESALVKYIYIIYQNAMRHPIVLSRTNSMRSMFKVHGLTLQASDT